MGSASRYLPCIVIMRSRFCLTEASRFFEPSGEFGIALRLCDYSANDIIEGPLQVHVLGSKPGQKLLRQRGDPVMQALITPLLLKGRVACMLGGGGNLVRLRDDCIEKGRPVLSV